MQVIPDPLRSLVSGILEQDLEVEGAKFQPFQNQFVVIFVLYNLGSQGLGYKLSKRIQGVYSDEAGNGCVNRAEHCIPLALDSDQHLDVQLLEEENVGQTDCKVQYEQSQLDLDESSQEQ